MQFIKDAFISHAIAARHLAIYTPQYLRYKKNCTNGSFLSVVLVDKWVLYRPFFLNNYIKSPEAIVFLMLTGHLDRKANFTNELLDAILVYKEALPAIKDHLVKSIFNSLNSSATWNIETWT